MSEMVERVAEALKGVGFIMPGAGGLKGQLHLSNGQAKEMAKAAIEAMRDVPKVCYDNYKCDKLWKELNSTEVWNLWIDAALK